MGIRTQPHRPIPLIPDAQRPEGDCRKKLIGFLPRITRILESFAKHDLSPPLFEELQEGFRVTVNKTTQKTTTREQVLELLQINPNMTRSELALQLSKSENTIKEHLAKLKVEGRLKRIGSDRSGSWMVVSHEERSEWGTLLLSELMIRRPACHSS